MLKTVAISLKSRQTLNLPLLNFRLSVFLLIFSLCSLFWGDRGSLAHQEVCLTAAGGAALAKQARPVVPRPPEPWLPLKQLMSQQPPAVPGPLSRGAPGFPARQAPPRDSQAQARPGPAAPAAAAVPYALGRLRRTMVLLQPHGRRQLAAKNRARPWNPPSILYNFPVAAPFAFHDTYNAPRGSHRYHHAVDIFAGVGTRVYAITDGEVHKLITWPEAGRTLLLKGQDGRGYGYMHLMAYAPGIYEGKAVRKGDLIAYVGRTGIRRGSAHLHLQVYRDHRFCRSDLINPYGLLVQLCQGRGVADLCQNR
jgi:murein DD-endopeptidase MepM/ murein hydrolase activator NlpD